MSMPHTFAAPLPVKIEPCPITTAVVEVRFEPSVHTEAVFGMAYELFRTEFGIVEPSPLSAIPNSIRDDDPNLRYQALYKLSSSLPQVGDLGIGPRVLTIYSPIPYQGWSNFIRMIKNTLDKLISSNLIAKIERTGLRYINTFTSEYSFKPNFEFTVSNSSFITDVFQFRQEFRIEENMLAITQYTGKSQDKHHLLDVDIICTNVNVESLFDTIENSHSREKSIFFGLLHSDFLTTLSPSFSDSSNL